MSELSSYENLTIKTQNKTKHEKPMHMLRSLWFGDAMWARFLSLARSKLRLCSANHRAGYSSNLACDWLSIVWAYSEQKTENGPRWNRIGTKLDSVMACCYTPPNHYRAQCWLTINDVLWHSHEGNFTGTAWDINTLCRFEAPTSSYLRLQPLLQRFNELTGLVVLLVSDVHC